MPSVILGNTSGGQLLISGNPWSGRLMNAGIQLKWVPSPSSPPRLGSGNAYIALSGNMTTNSGAVLGSGGAASGMVDGMCLGPGDAYYIEPSVIANSQGTGSGVFNIYAACDALVSGVGRIYFEPFLGFRG